LASKELGERTQASADAMQTLTEDMQWIALKTQDDTVSMKVITLVTLFFLPGTFMSTVMSTPIVTFPINDEGQQRKVVATGAVQLWFTVTVPLMIFTFLAWWGVKILERHRQQKERARYEDSLKQRAALNNKV